MRLCDDTDYSDYSLHVLMRKTAATLNTPASSRFRTCNESAMPDDVNVSPRHPRKAKAAFRVKAVRPKRMNS